MLIGGVLRNAKPTEPTCQKKKKALSKEGDLLLVDKEGSQKTKL